MKKQQHHILGLAAVVATGLLSLGSAQANPGYAQNLDLVFFLQSNDPDFSTNIVTVAAGNLSTIRDQRNTDAYSVLVTDSFGGFLSDDAVYGADWDINTNLYAGAFGTRGDGSFINNQFGTTGDSNRTVYFTQARGNTINPGQAASSPSTLVDNAVLAARTSSMNVVQNEFETQPGAASPFSEPAGSSTLDDQAPIGGVQFANLAGVGNFLAAPFSFGGQNDVILVLDLYRMKPSATNAGFLSTDPVGVALTPLFLGNVVFKSTGEVGFLTVPEPTTATMIALAIGGLALRNRRRANA